MKLQIKKQYLHVHFHEFCLPLTDENLSSPDPLVQEKAITAFPNFLGEYLKDKETGNLLVARRDNIIAEYFKEINTSELHRRGISLALGKL